MVHLDAAASSDYDRPLNCKCPDSSDCVLAISIFSACGGGAACVPWVYGALTTAGRSDISAIRIYDIGSGRPSNIARFRMNYTFPLAAVHFVSIEDGS